MSTRPELELLPDVEQLVSAYLRSKPRITALVQDRVYTVFPAQAGSGPLLLVQRIGGDPPFSQPLVLDVAQLQIDAYGGPKKTAHDLAATARAVLTELEGQVRPEGVVASVRFASLRFLPDETFNPHRPRYLFDVAVAVRTPIALGARGESELTYPIPSPSG
jgi:Protein of unknown function (DUF3168)